MLALAVDLGGTHAMCAVVRDEEVLAKRTVTCSGAHGLGEMLPHFAQAFRELADTCHVAIADCAGVALGFCGLAGAESGRVLSTNLKYEDAPNLDLPAWWKGELGLPFRIENDARMALLGEQAAGAARGFDDVVMMTLGTGIGGAAMIGGRLLRGKHSQAGCLGGHLVMRPDGRDCSCGGKGCAESEASTYALPDVCRNWPGFASSALAHEKVLQYAGVFRAADAGDEVASAILRHSIDVWAALAVSLVHAYDPEVLVVGGGIMRRSEDILPHIRARVERDAWTPWGKVQVRQAQCGDEAALLGALPLLREFSS